MSQFTIYQDSYINATILSNRFIDEYMTDANDAQLKVYLYLVRMMSANLSTSVTDIADRFNYTEKDVLRAFKYWKGKGILDLDMDETGNLTGVHLKNLCKCESVGPSVEETHRPQLLITPQTIVSSLGKQTVFEESEVAKAEETVPAKPAYSAKKVREFKESHAASDNGIDIFYLAEEYRKKPLSQSDVNTIIYIVDELGFDEEMFDHLLQTCASRDKCDFRYIEKVAISWKEKGVKTPEEADRLGGRYDKKVYEIMRQLGKTGNSPTDREVTYITKWTDEYGFSDELIMEACGRTVMAVDKNRFQYADSILKSWKENGVGTLKDVEELDKSFSRKSSAKPSKGDSSTAGADSSNKFNRFTQKTYDFSELEKKLVKN
ncbi:MAG: DnaD domain protein [Lachnospiraceae bacterium]|nr:DnaD domain protein [Lachnospiraceae bacterium]